MAADENASIVTAPQIAVPRRNTIRTPADLVGYFGGLKRAPLLAPSALLRFGSSERDDGCDGHEADEHKDHATTR
jgi:hypothetical protein